METTAEKKQPKPIHKVPGAEQEADRWLEVFSIFIHDLETPFASIKYLIRLMESGKYDTQNPTHVRLVDSSRIAVERAESILYDIMAVAKAGQIGIPVEMTNLVPEVIIREAIELAGNSAEERDIEITFTNNSGNIPVKADPKLLKRTMDNLIYNALRHTPEGSRVAVYTEPGENCIFIHVKDSGPGLGDIDSNMLFEKYGQVHLRSQGKHRGVGLGLYFCRLAATGMGGTILADDHPKGGAVFTLSLQKVGD